MEWTEKKKVLAKILNNAAHTAEPNYRAVKYFDILAIPLETEDIDSLVFENLTEATEVLLAFSKSKSESKVREDLWQKASEEFYDNENEPLRLKILKNKPIERP
jgi:hypothetical protein